MRQLIKILTTIVILSPIDVIAQQLNVAPAHLVCDYKVPEKVDNQVKNKIQKALAKYGISAVPGASRFAMVPTVSINNEQTTATVPPYCDMDFDFSIALQDAFSGKVFATYSMEVTSRGTNKSNAISKGISALKMNDPSFISFCDEARVKVIDYYETNMSAIIARANAAASARNFDEALYILSEIPEECPSFNQRVMPLVQGYLKTQLDLYGEQVLARAKAAWAASPNYEGAAKVAEILADMPPSCSSSAAAAQFVKSIETKCDALQKWEMKFAEKELDYAHNERKAEIAAWQAIATAYAKSQPRVINNYVVHLW